MDKVAEALLGSAAAGRPAECHGVGGPDVDLDWEDWDPKETTFVQHMIAGSFAGIAEHTVMFPVDTVKTFVQCQECALTEGCLKQQTRAATGLTSLDAATALVRQQGFLRLWRGVSTMLSACVPAHAAYFSALETCKARFGVNGPEHNVAGAAAAGVIATVFHDSIMTPMDVIKQRLQLGYYQGLMHCASVIARTEGLRAFYLSLPVTLFMNIPYGGVMVAANESIKRVLNPNGDYSLGTYLLAGSGAGALAAAATTPLDLIKTRLQTQAAGAGLADMGAAGVGAAGGGPHAPAGPSVGAGAGGVRVTSSSSSSSSSTPPPSSGGGGGGGGGGSSSGGGGGPPPRGMAGSGGGVGGAVGGGIHPASSPFTPPLAASAHHAHLPGEAPRPPLPSQPARSHVTSTDGACRRAERTRIKYKGIVDAARQIHAAEGYAGFFRGVVPRLLVHTPSVAISWTTYETVKELLRTWSAPNGGGGAAGGGGMKPPKQQG